MARLIVPEHEVDLDIGGQLIVRMRAAADDRDYEGGHSDGDAILCEALQAAASGNLTPADADMILKSYERITRYCA